MDPVAALKTSGGQNQHSNNEEENKAILVTKLSELNDYIQKGELQNIKRIIEYFYENLSYNKRILAAIYRSGNKCVTQTEAIISACYHKRVEILDYLLNESDILDHLTDSSLDVHQVEMQKKTAFRYAICSDSFRMVEMLYDYWSGNVHWTEHNISKMEKLGDLLDAACTEVEDLLTQVPQLLVDARCLVKFNEFQLELYRYLHTLPDSKDKTEKAMLNRLLSVLRIYNKYSNLDYVRWPLSDPERELAFKHLLKDKSSICCIATAYIMYEVFFRKLDFNVCSLILENLSVLRKHLDNRFNKTQEEFNNFPNLYSSYVNEVSMYEEIECTIYHYIYRTSEDWRLYLPGDREPTLIKGRVGFHKGKIYNLKLKFDSYKVYNGPVLFLERLNLERCVNKLKEFIESHVMSTDPVPNTSTSTKSQNNAGNQQKNKYLPKILDDNYLKQTVYMRDYYSLRKIVYYVESLQNSNEIDILMIERVLQVIGEMLKSTTAMLKSTIDSQHLSPFTKALLQTAISVETLGHLNNLRKTLARVDEGQLSNRIDIANKQDQIFGEVKQDLKEFLQLANPILDIYKYMLDKSLLEKGLQLLDERVKKLPAEAKIYKDNIYDLFKTYGKEFEDKFVEAVWKHTSLTRQLLREIPWLLNNRDDILLNKQLASTRITRIAVVMLPIYIENIEKTLDRIRKNNENVTKFNNELDRHNIKKIKLYPSTTDINKTRGSILDQQKKRNKTFDPLLDKLNNLKDLKMHWESVKTVLKLVFCEMNCEVFNKSHSEFVKSIDVPNEQTLDDVLKFLLDIKIVCEQHKELCIKKGLDLPSYPDLNKTHSFDAINKLDDIFKENKKESVPEIRREQLLFCLKDRLDHLKTVLEYPKQISQSQYLLKYKRDQKFRFKLEMLLGDIANILVHCKIRLMNKSTKLLKEIDLGNVLDHGNPFLDVIGECLDSRDLPSAFVSKAIMFANDRDAIVALYELFKQNIEPNVIRDGNINGMNDDQIKYLDQFKMCDSDRQKTYLKLIYIYKNK